ncbi:hypothetical protein [Bradyrhizobium diazoefficiens]
MQPLIAVGMVEMPVGVDEMGDGIGAETGQRIGELGARHADAGIDQELAVGPGQDGDVAAGAFEHADIVAKPGGRDRRNCRTVLDQADEAARLGVGLARCEPSGGGGERGAADATQAKAAPR